MPYRIPPHRLLYVSYDDPVDLLHPSLPLPRQRGRFTDGRGDEPYHHGAQLHEWRSQARESHVQVILWAVGCE